MDDWVDIEKPTGGKLAIRSATSSESPIVSSEFYGTIERCALARVAAAKTSIFHVDLGEEPVYTTFLNGLAQELKRRYDCTACRHFANRFGDLALVNEDGTLQPLLWSATDFENDKQMAKIYGEAVQALSERFVNAKVTFEFKIVEKSKSVGDEEKGGFSHMCLRFPESLVRRTDLPGFTSASTPELANMLDRILTDYKLGTIRKVNSMLQENKLPYADNHKASARWLLKLVEDDKMGKAKSPNARHNLLYRYAASSFVGSLNQMRSGPLGVLLENVKNNCSWNFILAQWKQICDPTAYMRPQAAPKQGNIDAAERLFERLGLKKDDLRRRLLVQDDVPDEAVIWSSESMRNKKIEKDQQKDKNAISGNIFSAVKPRTKPTALPATDETPPSTVTFTRFVTKVLPKAKHVDCWLRPRSSITTLVTGLKGSKPLMQWHDEEGKNLASHYLWTSPPYVEKHNLKPGWNEVRCLIPLPWLWDGAPLTTTFPLLDPDGEGRDQYKYYHKHKGFRYLFVLEENHESNLTVLPLFPELLKSEFHGVRSTVEAFTKTESLHDVEDGMAKGGFVGGVEASRSESDQKLKMRVEFFDGEVETYTLTLFE